MARSAHRGCADRKYIKGAIQLAGNGTAWLGMDSVQRLSVEIPTDAIGLINLRSRSSMSLGAVIDLYNNEHMWKHLLNGCMSRHIYLSNRLSVVAFLGTVITTSTYGTGYLSFSSCKTIHYLNCLHKATLHTLHL